MDFDCTHCEKGRYSYWLYFDFKQESVRKVGQDPPWSIDVPEALGNALGVDLAALYKRGIICESQAFGIGAFAYYRRVVEGAVDMIISWLKDALGAEGGRELEAALEALEAVPPVQKTAEKIRIAKDYMPADLRPGGRNPLGVLYDALSRGLHELPEEECLERGAHIRASISYLMINLSARRKAGEEFAESLQRLDLQPGGPDRT